MQVYNAIILRVLCICVLLVNSLLCHAQDVLLTDSVTLLNTARVVQLSVDRQDNILVADAAGTISKYDSTGKLLASFSAGRPAMPTLLEAWGGLNVFAFYQQQQQYVQLDRFLTDNQPAINLSQSANLGFVRLMCPAQDQNFWLIDDQDFSLKKLSSSLNTVLFTTPLDLVLPNTAQYDVVFMREYQNNLYILTKAQGLLIFDNLGNLKGKYPLIGLSFLSFMGEAMLYSKSNVSQGPLTICVNNGFPFYKERCYNIVSVLVKGNTKIAATSNRLCVLDQSTEKVTLYKLPNGLK